MKAEVAIAAVFAFLVLVVPILSFTARATLPPLIEAAIRVALVVPTAGHPDLDARLRQLEAETRQLREELESVRRFRGAEASLAAIAIASSGTAPPTPDARPGRPLSILGSEPRGEA